MLKVAKVVLTRTESRKDISPVELSKMGRELRTFLQSIPRPLHLSDNMESVHIFLDIRACALAGDIPTAIELLNSDSLKKSTIGTGGHLSSIMLAYHAVILAIGRVEGPLPLLDFITSHWTFLEPYLKHWSLSEQWSANDRLPNRQLRNAVFSQLSLAAQPATLFAQTKELEPSMRDIVAELLLLACAENGMSRKAYDLFLEIRHQQFPFSELLRLRLVRCLVRDASFGPARAVMSSITHRDNIPSIDFLKTALFTSAHEANIEEAEEFYATLVKRNMAGPKELSLRLHAHASRGRIAHTLKLFDEHYPRGINGLRDNSPSIHVFSAVIHAHSMRGDIDGINRWLEELINHEFAPDAHIYNMILAAFAQRGDMESVKDVLEQMRGAGQPPNIVTYTQLLTLLAHRADPVAAELVYKRAVREGVVPNRRMVSTLMNAHVNAGSWRGVIRVFRYLQRTPEGDVGLTIEVYNTLLKAYVLIGAPFYVVSKLFLQLEKTTLKPDSITYTLLIQSACDAAKMGVAHAIFREMDKESQRVGWEAKTQVDAYALTILMTGWLRLQNRVEAKKVYDSMISRGIQPHSTAYTAIVTSYANQRSEDGIELAAEFINSLMGSADDKEWERHFWGRGTALSQIYGPLLRAYKRNQTVEDVEKSIQEFIDQGGQPSLGMFGLLMDCYRRSGDIDGVLELWPQIFKFGIKYLKDTYITEAPLSENMMLRSSIISIPLSVYIDALSAAGHHDRIAQVWKECRDAGMAFDSHNWNHLCVALVRAGALERAFQVIEKVVLPYRVRAMQLEAHDDGQNSPLLFDVGVDEESQVNFEDLQPEGEANLRLEVRRDQRSHLLEKQFPPDAFPDLDLEAEEFTSDQYVDPLQILHTVSPSWNLWRPHAVALMELGKALTQLRRGALPKPTVPRGPDGVQPLVQEPTAGELEIERKLAHETAGRIEANYPQTVSLVERKKNKTMRGRTAFISGRFGLRNDM
jgi:pentatricopeptide repeat-containing protein PET309